MQFPDRTPEQRLLAAVVSLAMRDTTAEPVKVGKHLEVNNDAASALDFLFTDASDAFLDLLDFNPQTFRKKLLEVMNDTSPKDIPFKSQQRRAFRINYKLWKTEYDRLGGRVARDEIEDDEDSRTHAEEQA